MLFLRLLFLLSCSAILACLAAPNVLGPEVGSRWLSDGFWASREGELTEPPLEPPSRSRKRIRGEATGTRYAPQNMFSLLTSEYPYAASSISPPATHAISVETSTNFMNDRTSTESPAESSTNVIGETSSNIKTVTPLITPSSSIISSTSEYVMQTTPGTETAFGSTIPSSSPKLGTKERLSSGAIAGIVLGAIFLLFGIAMGVLVVRRYQKRDRHQNQLLRAATAISPFPPPQMPFTRHRKRRHRDEELAHWSAGLTERHDRPGAPDTRTTTRSMRRGRGERLQREERFVYHNDSGWRSLARSMRQSEIASPSVINVPPAYQAL
ncbi:hypothetical protein Moror_12021 [Moniliophthora roreri MCA 2997]|nr:hypothetical protein Moror_12021 [Moniliophthora roreri MCA 2997]